MLSVIDPTRNRNQFVNNCLSSPKNKALCESRRGAYDWRERFTTECFIPDLASVQEYNQVYGTNYQNWFQIYLNCLPRRKISAGINHITGVLENGLLYIWQRDDNGFKGHTIYSGNMDINFSAVGKSGNLAHGIYNNNILSIIRLHPEVIVDTQLNNVYDIVCRDKVTIILDMSGTVYYSDIRNGICGFLRETPLTLERHTKLRDGKYIRIATGNEFIVALTNDGIGIIKKFIDNVWGNDKFIQIMMNLNQRIIDISAEEENVACLLRNGDILYFNAITERLIGILPGDRFHNQVFQSLSSGTNFSIAVLSDGSAQYFYPRETSGGRGTQEIEYTIIENQGFIQADGSKDFFVGLTNIGKVGIWPVRANWQPFYLEPQIRDVNLPLGVNFVRSLN